MSSQPLCIVPMGRFGESRLVPPLARYLSRAFHSQVRVEAPVADVDHAFDPDRNQHDSSTILLTLLENKPADARRTLGILEVDLFVPILTFLFGEAQYKGPAAVVSIHRLKNEFYGMPPSPHLLQERLIKEAVHEIGHTFGLVHCYTARCVMNSSTCVEDIDEKSMLFCRSCESAVGRALAD